MSIHPIPEITAEAENFRLEPLPDMPNIKFVRRDPVEPVPVGTYIARVFRVTGYDPDCDGSLMVRMQSVDFDGEPTGWEVDSLGLYPDSSVVLDSPGDLKP